MQSVPLLPTGDSHTPGVRYWLKKVDADLQLRASMRMARHANTRCMQTPENERASSHAAHDSKADQQAGSIPSRPGMCLSAPVVDNVVHERQRVVVNEGLERSEVLQRPITHERFH